MSRHLQQFIRNKTEGEQNRSVRTIRSTTSYNLSDFLPPSKDVVKSQIIPLVLKLKEKVQTEPCEKIKQSTVNELIRKNQLLEQEKNILRDELQLMKNQLEKYRQTLEEKQRLNRSLNEKLEEEKKVRKPLIALERRNIQFQLFPKYKQTYQVSVQTELESSPPLASHPKESKMTYSTDSQMQQIYQKLENLKMPKRKPEYPLPSMKTDRARPMATYWGSNDKENVMKRSNMMDKVSYAEKQERVKNETLELYSMSLSTGERLMSEYLDDPLL